MQEKTRKISPQHAAEIGRQLDRWRRQSKLTQDEICRISGTTQGQVSRLLGGKFSKPTPPLLRLCDAAGINPNASTSTKDDQRTSLAARLTREVLQCWDGTEAHASDMIQLLRTTVALRSRKSR